MITGRQIHDTEKDCMDKFGTMWGCETIELTEAELQAIIDGKYVCTDDGEYAHYICVEGRPIDA